MSERVILVNERDEAVGTAEKLRAHQRGQLHRAFSVFVLNGQDEILLQRRAATKYHSPSLWSNSCCSHPRPAEATLDAAHRRLREELGFDCPLESMGAFVYRADVGGGLIEHEYDHLLLGRWEGEPTPAPAEVDDWRWISLPALRREIARTPHRFTYWLRAALRELDGRDALPGTAADRVA
jgi:isopentenyl-diphosphate delta-isomerase